MKSKRGTGAVKGTLRTFKNTPSNELSFEECRRLIRKKGYIAWSGWGNSTISWPPGM